MLKRNRCTAAAGRLVVAGDDAIAGVDICVGDGGGGGGGCVLFLFFLFLLFLILSLGATLGRRGLGDDR